jgi:hypothetical protein
MSGKADEFRYCHSIHDASLSELIDSAYAHLESCFDEGYVKRVLHSLLSDADRYFSFTPSFIGLGGLPGVGKTTYAFNKYRSHFFIIDLDGYRRFHPHYASFDSTNLISQTNSFASYIGDLIIEVLAHMSCDIMYVSTFSRFDIWGDFFKTHEYLNGYAKRLIVLGAPTEVCFQSMLFRNGQEKNCPGIIVPRLADLGFLTEQSIKLKVALGLYIEQNTFDSVEFLYKPDMSAGFVSVDYQHFISTLDVVS